jgi:hypothetical protein
MYLYIEKKENQEKNSFFGKQDFFPGLSGAVASRL